MTNQIQSASKPKYDLQERTAAFGGAVIELCKTVVRNPVNNPLISQLIRSSTSIGANYMEADGAESKKDFQHKIMICKKEAKETIHWLDMLMVADQDLREPLIKLRQEAKELVLIFSKIVINSRSPQSI